MVEFTGWCNFDHTTSSFRQDFKYEYGGMFLFSEICETFGFIRRIEYRKECWFTEITRNLSCSLPKFCSSQNKYLWERKKTDLFVDCFIIWWKYVSVKWWHIKWAWKKAVPGSYTGDEWCRCGYGITKFVPFPQQILWEKGHRFAWWVRYAITGILCIWILEGTDGLYSKPVQCNVQDKSISWAGNYDRYYES